MYTYKTKNRKICIYWLVLEFLQNSKCPPRAVRHQSSQSRKGIDSENPEKYYSFIFFNLKIHSNILFLHFWILNSDFAS